MWTSIKQSADEALAEAIYGELGHYAQQNGNIFSFYQEYCIARCSQQLLRAFINKYHDAWELARKNNTYVPHIRSHWQIKNQPHIQVNAEAFIVRHNDRKTQAVLNAIEDYLTPDDPQYADEETEYRLFPMNPEDLKDICDIKL